MPTTMPTPTTAPATRPPALREMRPTLTPALPSQPSWVRRCATVAAHETPISTIQALVSRRNLAAFDSGVAAGAGSGLVCFSSIVFSGIHDPLKGGRAGETRTRNPRFWRPIVYQLTYRPTAP